MKAEVYNEINNLGLNYLCSVSNEKNNYVVPNDYFTNKKVELFTLSVDKTEGYSIQQDYFEQKKNQLLQIAEQPQTTKQEVTKNKAKTTSIFTLNKWAPIAAALALILSGYFILNKTLTQSKVTEIAQQVSVEDELMSEVFSESELAFISEKGLNYFEESLFESETEDSLLDFGDDDLFNLEETI